MKFKLVFILFLSLSLSGCSQSVKSIAEREKIIVISPEDFDKIPDDAQLVDIRTPQEYATGHIKNAINIDFYKPSFLNKMEATLDKNKPVYLYCRSGNRTGTASRILSEAGFKKIYDLKGGINNWNTKHLKIIR